MALGHQATVDYSCIAADFLEGLLRDRYGFSGEMDIRYWYRGLNDTYSIQASHGKFMLRVYRHGWRAQSEIEGECAIIDRANQDEPRLVAPFIRDTSGQAIQTIAAPEGARPAVLFQWAQGNYGTPVEETRSEQIGSALALLHQRWDDLPDTLARPVFNQSFLVDKPLAVYRYYADTRDDLMGRLAEMERALVMPFALLTRAQAHFGVCHGDVHGGNWAYDPQGVTLFDLDFAGYGWRVWDIVCFYQTLIDEAHSHGRRHWQAFLRGYEAHSALADCEREAIPGLAAVRRFWGHGLRMANLTGRPSYWMGQPHLIGCIREVEQWLAGERILQ